MSSVDAHIGDLADYVHKWADETFPDRLPKAALTKLVMSEIPELLVELREQGPGPHLAGEWADCMILLLDLAKIWHINPAEAIMGKMEVNEKRAWVKDEELGHYQHRDYEEEPVLIGFGQAPDGGPPPVTYAEGPVQTFKEPACACPKEWPDLKFLIFTTKDGRKYCASCAKRIYDER